MMDNEQFQKEQKRIGFNMAVCMYMVGAMEYLHGVHPDRIKFIAFEIAHMGISGISPAKKDYHVRLIPNKTMSGYEVLAYYYVSWAIAIPDQLDELNLPFKDEYKMASTLYEKRK